MTDYLQLLEHSYAMQRQHSMGCPPESRPEYLADHIFSFTTYEQEMSEMFAARALLVCDAITRGKTFEYIAEDEDRMWFLLMCNMPFFKDRLDWGGSIRGAWWDHEDQELFTVGLWVGEEQPTAWKFTEEEWEQFVQALVVFGGKK